MRDLGDKEVNDDWVKRKFLLAIMPFEKNTTKIIRSRSDFATMSSNDILSEFISLKIMSKNADDALARSRGYKKNNLALKAKVSYEEDEEEDDESIKHS